DAQRAVRERPYLGTRATYTRHAFAADAMPRADSSIAYPSLASALPWISVWDAPVLARAANAGRAADDSLTPIGWRTTPAGLVADVIASPPQGASAHTPWTAAHVLASDADERGAPIRVGGPIGTS